MPSANTNTVNAGARASDTKAGRGVNLLLDVLTALLITFAAGFLLLQASLRAGVPNADNESVYDPSVFQTLQ